MVADSVNACRGGVDDFHGLTSTRKKTRVTLTKEETNEQSLELFVRNHAW